MNELIQRKSLCWIPDELPPNVRLEGNGIITCHDPPIALRTKH